MLSPKIPRSNTLPTDKIYLVVLYSSVSWHLETEIIFDNSLKLIPVTSEYGEELYKALSPQVTSQSTLQFNIPAVITVDLNQCTVNEASDRVERLRLLLALLCPNKLNFELRAIYSEGQLLPIAPDCHSFTHENQETEVTYDHWLKTKNLYEKYYSLQASGQIVSRYSNALVYFHIAMGQYYSDMRLLMFITSISALLMSRTKATKGRTTDMFKERPLLFANKLQISTTLRPEDLSDLWSARCRIDHNGHAFTTVAKDYVKCSPALEELKRLLSMFLITFLESQSCRDLLPDSDSALDMQLPLSVK